MWYCWTTLGVLLLIFSIILFAVGHHIGKVANSDDELGTVFVGAILFILSVVLLIFSIGSGVNNYAQIPRIHRDIQLEQTNKEHYHEAMEYNLGDESNERKSASHVRWFKDGDFSEAKDNKTWKQNYDDWFYNKSLITYHKMELKYYTHPLHNWRDGLSMNTLYSSINKPTNY